MEVSPEYIRYDFYVSSGGFIMTYLSSYELELDIGFALLEKVEGNQGPERFRSVPDEGTFDNLLLTGVYGGMVDPDEAQEFYIYNVQWPDELDDLDDDLMAILSEELDSLFPGWVFDETKNKIYILQDPDAPPPA